MHWNHYLVANEFILHSDLKALEYVQGQHKSGKLNQGVEALLKRYMVLFELDAWFLGFDHPKSLYSEDEDFWDFMRSVTHINKLYF